MKKKIVHVLTGSIAAYKSPEITERLREAGYDVTCVLTPAAKKFVTTETLRALSGNPVYDDMWQDPVQGESRILHTSLADQAALVLVAPASADFLARAACGMADDLAACLLLATKAPVFWAPAMNDNMYAHPITQQNMDRLRKIGHRFIDPIEGHLACGRTALGHIAETATIVKLVTDYLK